MDLRIQRTKRSITDAFLKLRVEKPIEKITVKELSELALINKATFYSHYKDIYDLTEHLEDEAINRILERISHPEELIANPKQATKELSKAMLSQSDFIKVLFSGSRSTFLINKLESRIKERIYNIYPEYQNNLESDILLTVLIQGCSHAFNVYSDRVDTNRLIEIIGTINEQMIQHCR